MKLNLFTLLLVVIITLVSCGETKDEPQPKRTVEQIKALLRAHTWEATSLKEGEVETLGTSLTSPYSYRWVFNESLILETFITYGNSNSTYMQSVYTVDADEPALDFVISRWKITELTETALKVETINRKGLTVRYQFIPKK